MNTTERGKRIIPAGDHLTAGSWGCRRCVCSVAQSSLTLCDPMDCSLPGSSVSGDSPGKNTGVGCQALLQGLFPTQGSNPGLPHCRQILYRLSHQGSPRDDHQVLLSTPCWWVPPPADGFGKEEGRGSPSSHTPEGHGLLGVGASGPSCLPDRSHLGKQQPGDLWQVPFSLPGGVHHPTTSPGPCLSVPHLLPQPECLQKAGVGTTYGFHVSGCWKCPPFVFSHRFGSLLLKWAKGQKTVSVKSQLVTVLGFKASQTLLQLVSCCWSVQAVSDTCMSVCYAKSLQSCPTLCDPIDGSPPGFPIPGKSVVMLHNPLFTKTHVGLPSLICPPRLYRADICPLLALHLYSHFCG